MLVTAFSIRDGLWQDRSIDKAAAIGRVIKDRRHGKDRRSLAAHISLVITRGSASRGHALQLTIPACDGAIAYAASSATTASNEIGTRVSRVFFVPGSVLRQPIVSQAVYPAGLRIVDCMGDRT